jgi:hypothetical protein
MCLPAEKEDLQRLLKQRTVIWNFVNGSPEAQ